MSNFTQNSTNGHWFEVTTRTGRTHILHQSKEGVLTSPDQNLDVSIYYDAMISGEVKRLFRRDEIE
ncbi:hypothetical protein PP914_gp188 [Arthrobacter phage Qui]|uniref:Uncharacterized protein n=1 Tax=Arthrobacter phage Qui TaxID=2603260 RepID=A0A5B8WKA7_9CAUD|nr:hypothetical protein PP914_gp188 [Arthrobacter phage Qui]QED11676.1 hypothetical protein SEA_QUI_188 [Arthrobacter phage Qui]QOC56507.1 hypothetical protein SEA_PAELLA_188 [Arthrobacter phage Paella]